MAGGSAAGGLRPGQTKPPQAPGSPAGTRGTAPAAVHQTFNPRRRFLQTQVLPPGPRGRTCSFSGASVVAGRSRPARIQDARRRVWCPSQTQSEQDRGVGRAFRVLGVPPRLRAWPESVSAGGCWRRPVGPRPALFLLSSRAHTHSQCSWASRAAHPAPWVSSQAQEVSLLLSRGRHLGVPESKAPWVLRGPALGPGWGEQACRGPHLSGSGVGVREGRPSSRLLLTHHSLLPQRPLSGAHGVATGALLVLVSLGPVPTAGSPVPTSPAGAQAATWGTSLTSDPGSNHPSAH